MTQTVTRPAVRNGILAALLATEYKRVYRADQDIEAVYFPEEALIAMVDTTDELPIDGAARKT